MGAPLKISVVVSSVSRSAGGVFDAVRQAYGAVLDDPDFSVRVFGTEDARTAQDLPDWAPVLVEAYPRAGPAALAYSPLLHMAVLNCEADILHQHGIWQSPSRTSVKWRERHRKPVIISTHGMLDPWALANSRWKKRAAGMLLENGNLRGAACLHALNQSELEAIRAYGLTNPVAIIANGVSFPATAAEPAVKTDLQNRKTLLFVGRIHPKKGLSELVEAWQSIKAQNLSIVREWKLVLAGWDDGGYFEALKVNIAARGLADDIEVPGPLFGEAKDRAFREASAFILPSYSEGLPMAVLEAWTYSLPVFMTRACNLPIGFAEDAAIEVTTDPSALADALVGTLPRDDLADFGAKGRNLAEQYFIWSAIGEQYRQLYRWLHEGCERSAAPDFVSL